VGSLNGLAALRQGNAHLAGCHLLDFVTGEYNLPYIRHFFPDQEPWVITLAEREQGLITIPGNPHQVYSLADLAGRNINFINRKRGSGTRLWIDHQLHQYGIPATHIQGYQGEVGTHTAVAQAILCGQADVGISIYAAAQQYGLAFIPLFTERYDLVIPADLLDPAAFSPLLDLLQTASIRQEISTLGGYNTAHTGERKIL
jgi:putative molybdopterin biosynthesis protein